MQRSQEEKPDQKERSERIRSMFGRIAHRYDLLNTLLSFGMDRMWRRRAIKLLDPQPNQVIVDIACGTGDVALAAARRQPDLRSIIALDFSEPMLELARRKIARCRPRAPIEVAAADATDLPLADGGADATTIAFGIRNVVDVPRALAQMFRVLRPGGKALIVEFAAPRGKVFGPLFSWYFTKVLPRLGGLISGSREAYEYLPSSVGSFFKPEELQELMRQAGFNILAVRSYSLGVVTAYLGGKSE